MSAVNNEEKGRPWLLLLTAVIWGTGFVAQSAGSDAVPAFTFTCARNLIGAAVLIPVILLMRKFSEKKGRRQNTDRRAMILGGISCGIMLCIAANLQQYAFDIGSSAGNAGFITACYILIVPLLGLFLKRKCGWNVWIAVAVALIGLYFLCIDGEFVIRKEDIYLFACALGFAVHIMVVDHFTGKADGVCISAIQFLTCGILSGICMLVTDLQKAGGMAPLLQTVFTKEALICILYAGAVSSGAGYTLQVVGQKNVNPTVASLLMSLESVFSVLFGWLLLHEKMSGRELSGCMLVFAAVILSQLKISAGSKKVV